mgnify:CR=1 FL=1
MPTSQPHRTPAVRHPSSRQKGNSQAGSSYLQGVAKREIRYGPVLLLEGPRTVGKSTLLRALTDRLGGDILDLDGLDDLDDLDDLDGLGTCAAVARDPAMMIDVPGPVLSLDPPIGLWAAVKGVERVRGAGGRG